MAAAASLALASLAPQAVADEARTKAQALFDEGVQAMNEKAYDRACRKLEEVVKLQPGKVGAMMQLAQCYEESGKLASASSRYRAAADAAAPSDERGSKARAKVEALAARVPKLTIVVAAANRAARGFTVTRGGRDVGTAEWDTAVPVDPGKYEILASAPGKKPWSLTVEVAAGDAKTRIEVPSLSDAEAASPASPQPAAAELPAQETPAQGWSTQKTAGVVLMGAGVVGVSPAAPWEPRRTASTARSRRSVRRMWIVASAHPRWPATTRRAGPSWGRSSAPACCSGRGS